MMQLISVCVYDLCCHRHQCYRILKHFPGVSFAITPEATTNIKIYTSLLFKIVFLSYGS